MTVSSQTPINRSTGNGVTTVFPYTFKIISSADMEVSVDGVVKTLTVDYTLSGVGNDAGGNVTMLAAPATSTSVVRRRNMALTRSTDYQDQGELPASTLDSDLDSAVLMIQQVDEKTDRAMVLPTYVSGFSTELPTPIANYFLRVNSAGTALELASEITPGALTVTPFIETLLNDTDATAARTTLGAAASGANTDITSLDGVLVGKGAGGVLSNTRYGASALTLNTTGSNNSTFGLNTLVANTTGYRNTAMGAYALYSNTTGYINTAIGFNALLANSSGIFNIAIGDSCLDSNTTGSDNTAVGISAMGTNTTGNSNVACGGEALTLGSTGSQNTAVGYQAHTNMANYSNSGGFGYQAIPGGSNQIRLGNSSVTVYTQSGTVSASDVRDKTDIRDTTLGLNFINSLRPVDYKWDIRLDYAPDFPDRSDFVDEYEYKAAVRAHAEASRPVNLTHDGSKKRTRYHHGLIAQEVGALVAATGVDFGGYQDFEVKGGEALQAVAYEELIAPLIKAVQELLATVTAQAARIEVLEARL